MGSSKTASALMTAYNYKEKGYWVTLYKPSTDNRDGQYIIKSRIGLSAEAKSATPDYSFLDQDYTYMDCIIVDEAQFLTTKQVDELKEMSSDIPVFCYGLRTDFQSHLFEGSKRLFEIADSISEIKSICKCGKKAIINMRVQGGKPVYDGDQIMIGGNESYVGVCYDCWKKGII